MNQLHDTRPAIGQRIEVVIFNFTGKEVLRGTYHEEAGRPMLDGIKLHPRRTEWTPA
jgi:hypothetical protein